MVEIARNITFGHYIDNGSRLTRLDPRAKIVGFVLLIAAFCYVSHFAALFIALLFCILLQILSRLSLSYILRGMRFIFVFLLFLFVLQILFYTSPTQSSSLLWRWSFLSLSWEGIAHSAQIDLRIIFIYYLTSLLMFTTSLVDLADGAETLLAPLRRFGLPIHELVMIFVIALKFVPILITEVERMSIAQATRGVRFGRGNPLRRILATSRLLVPLFLSGLQRVETLSIAMEARCYRAGFRGWRRSKRRALHMSWMDGVALTGVVVVSMAMVIINLVSHF
jgi:energy-coupling factor transport system permease protein